MASPQCPYSSCLRIYSSSYNLKKHIEACHLKLKPFVCSICHKAFPYKHSFNHHNSLHLRCKPISQVESKLLSSTLKATVRLLGRRLMRGLETSRELDATDNVTLVGNTDSPV